MSSDMFAANQEIVFSDRKQQILQEAIGIIASDGYGKLTMRALARASGMKLGALQYHFRTREDMLRALAAYISDTYRQSFDALKADAITLSIREIAQFILELGAETPWHVSRFHPTYMLRDVPSTPVATLKRSREIGLEAGLHYVYTGNIPGDQ